MGVCVCCDVTHEVVFYSHPILLFVWPLLLLLAIIQGCLDIALLHLGQMKPRGLPAPWGPCSPQASEGELAQVHGAGGLCQRGVPFVGRRGLRKRTPYLLTTQLFNFLGNMGYMSVKD